MTMMGKTVESIGGASTLGAIIMNAMRPELINQILTIILSLISIGYMSWKWYNEIKKSK
jgi:hypothetical protein